MAYQYKTTAQLKDKELQINSIYERYDGVTIYGVIRDTNEPFKHTFGARSRPANEALGIRDSLPVIAKISKRGPYTDLIISPRR